jgi:hypothetical protein
MRTARRCIFVSRIILGVAAGTGVMTVMTPLASAQKGKQSEAKKRAAARQAYTQGTEAFQRRDYAAAFEHFRAANELIPAPHSLYWMAQSLDRAGRTDEAIAAYEVFLANENASKLGEDKVAGARARLAELKAGGEDVYGAPESGAVAEPEPTQGAASSTFEAEIPALPPEPPGPSFWERYVPQANVAELGLLVGPLFISRAHNLHDEAQTRRSYSLPAWLFGFRAAYFPMSFAGIEVEYAHGVGSVDKPGDVDGGASFNTLRGYVVAQFGSSRLIPFATAGAGVLHASSDRLGTDADLILQLGLGLKFAVSEMISLRLDVREDVMQGENGQVLDDVSFTEEVLLGVSLTFGR